MLEKKIITNYSLRYFSEDNQNAIFFFRRVEDDKLENDEKIEERSSDDDEIEEGGSLGLFVKKSKGKKKKSGRKSPWTSEDIDDFIDIVVSNTFYKRKLIFTNTKCQRNGEIYAEILTELKKRATARSKELEFSVKQLRTKFKKRVSDCKQAALTIRTATGTKRFQENRGLGNWFKSLFAVVQTRDSCQPDQAIEPSSLKQSTSSDKSSKSADSDKSFQDHLENNDDSEGGLFIPIKKRKKEKPKEKLEAAILEASELVKEVVNNDPTKELINFLREEMDRSREHECKMIQLLIQPHLDSNSFHSGSAQYTLSGLLITEHFCQTHQIGQDGQRGPSGLSPQHVACHQLKMKNSNLVMAVCFKICKAGRNYISLSARQSCSVELLFHSLIPV